MEQIDEKANSDHTSPSNSPTPYNANIASPNKLIQNTPN